MAAIDSLPLLGDSAAKSAHPGVTFGRYLLRFRIAAGGMATVFLGQLQAATGFERWFSIKVIHAHLAREPRFVQMFFDEARLLARLSHPNVCSVVDFGECERTYFLAMEYLQGESLSNVLQRVAGRADFPFAIAARIVTDAARGLHAAHELRDAAGAPAQVVHRDVSPQNVIVLYEGPTKVLDFGIARSNERLVDATVSGTVRGKVSYMAPEQLRGEPLDRRADVYALGVLLWEATTGRRLFKRASDALVMDAVLNETVPHPSDFEDDYPDELEQIVMRALSRNRADRHPTADALARELEVFIAHSGSLASHTDVADFMRANFDERIAQRESLLHHVWSNGPTREVPTPQSTDKPAYGNSDVTQSAVSIPVPGMAAITTEEHVAESTSRRTEYARSVALAAIGAVLLALVGVRVYSGRSHEALTPSPASRPAMVTVPPAPSITVNPVPILSNPVTPIAVVPVEIHDAGTTRTVRTHTIHTNIRSGPTHRPHDSNLMIPSYEE